jgi:hypothetical protein
MKDALAGAATGLRNAEHAQEFAFICAGIPIGPNTIRRPVHPYFKTVHTFLKIPFPSHIHAQFSQQADGKPRTKKHK